MKFEVDSEEQKAIKEWLKHNKVTICPPGAKTEPGEVGYTWGRKKKKAAPKKKAKKEK